MTIQSGSSDSASQKSGIKASVPKTKPNESGNALSPAAAQLVRIVNDLRAIATTSENQQQFVSNVLELAVLHSPLLCAAWFRSVPDQAPAISESRYSNPTLDNANIRSQLAKGATLACESGTTQIIRSDKVRGAKVMAIPFYLDETSTAVLCGIIHDNPSSVSEGLSICQLIATHYDLWRSRDELTKLAFEVRSTATVLELVERAQDTKSVKNACLVIANELKELLRCDYVAVGLRSENKIGCKLHAISSMSEFDAQSRETALFRSAFDEAIMREQFTVYPSRSEGQRNATLSHKKLALQMRCEAAITIPVRNQSDKIIGAVTVAGNRNLDRNPATRNLIQALEHPLGGIVEVVKYAEGGWLRKATRFMVSPEQTNMVWATWAVALVSLVAMFVPVQHRIKCKCISEPTVRRMSVAPYDGLLENTFVEPGDLVNKGQLLARMDSREIRFKLAGIEADRMRAIKKRDSHHANKEIPDAMMADLERTKLEEETKLLKYREQNFEIVSPIDGIVLSGSLDHRENMPVKLGDSLFEIAPLNPLRVELAVPADEVMHVELGQVVKFRFDGFGTQTFEGVVKRIRPSTTIRNDENVFVAEAVLSNEDGTVRPGMEGNAKIFASKRRLGWCIFHRPWEKFVTAIGM